MPASVSHGGGSSFDYLVPFNLIRAAIVVYSGWVAVHFEKRGLWRASLVGALVLFVDHPVVVGGIFLVQGEFKAFLGVLVSYFMFVWVAMLLALSGGLFARLRHTGKNT